VQDRAPCTDSRTLLGGAVVEDGSDSRRPEAGDPATERSKQRRRWAGNSGLRRRRFAPRPGVVRPSRGCAPPAPGAAPGSPLIDRSDPEEIELGDRDFDAVICECSFRTFRDKRAAAAEMARLLRPDGRLGLSDLTRQGTLPPELATQLGWIACIADALSADEGAGHLQGAGLEVRCVEPHDDALRELVETMRSRLDAGRLLGTLGKLNLPGADLERGQSLARTALDEVGAGPARLRHRNRGQRIGLIPPSARAPLLWIARR